MSTQLQSKVPGLVQNFPDCLFMLQSKEEMGGPGNTDLKAAAQGLRLPSPGTLGALPGPSAGFPAPKEDWRSKFRSSDSFTSDRGAAVSQHRSMTPHCCR